MKRGRKILKECKCCNKEFSALLIHIRQGKGLFCGKECYQKFRRDNAKDPNYLNRIYQKKAKYGLDEKTYLAMFDVQKNKCKICKNNFTEDNKACVDHSHLNGKIRGLLCGNCNKALGLFKDNIENIKSALLYLQESNPNEG